MAHYPIKCVHCMRALEGAEVLFGVENAIGDAYGQSMAQTTPETGVKEEKVAPESLGSRLDEVKKFSYDEIEEDEVSSAPAEEEAPQHVWKPYMTVDELKVWCEDSGLVFSPREMDVVLTKDFQGLPGTEGPLYPAIQFQREPGGVLYTATERYCPHCGKRLPSQSGQCPTYNIAMMGTTASGKTVYLCSLINQLTQFGGISQNSPKERILCGSIVANRECIPNEIFDFAPEVVRSGKLPATTQALVQEPLVMRIDYRAGKYARSCLISFVDMRGEDFVMADGQNLIRRTRVFQEADGYIMLINPMNLDDIAYAVNGYNEETVRSVQAHGNMIRNIQAYITGIIGKLQKPAVVMLSKADLLYRHRGALRNVVSMSNNVMVQRNVRYWFSLGHVREIAKGVNDILRLDEQLYGSLQAIFENVTFSAVSSLGYDADDGAGSGDKVIQNFHMIRSDRVLDPLLIMLVQQKFLPPFDRMESQESINTYMNQWASIF